jgi:threonine synthase
MIRDMLEVGALEGVSAAPEGAASLSALRRLIADGTVAPHETVVLFNTGGALKYLDLLKTEPARAERHAP